MFTAAGGIGAHEGNLGQEGWKRHLNKVARSSFITALLLLCTSICSFRAWLLSRYPHFNRASYENWEEIAHVEVTRRHRHELWRAEHDASDDGPPISYSNEGSASASGDRAEGATPASAAASEDVSDALSFEGDSGRDLLEWLRQGRWVPYDDLRPDLRVS